MEFSSRKRRGIKIVLIAKPFEDTSEAFEKQLQQLQLQSTTLVCNFFGQPTRTQGRGPEYKADADSGPTTYYFHGDKAIDAVLPHMGESARTAAAVIGSAMAAGLAALILTHERDNSPSSAVKAVLQRQRIRHCFGRLVAGADERVRTGGQRMPWFLSKEAGDVGSQGQARLRAMLY